MALHHDTRGDGCPVVELTSATCELVGDLVRDALDEIAALGPDHALDDEERRVYVLDNVLSALTRTDDLEDGEDALIAEEVDWRLSLLGDERTNEAFPPRVPTAEDHAVISSLQVGYLVQLQSLLPERAA